MCFEKWDCFKQYFTHYPYSKIRFLISMIFLFIARIFFKTGAKIYKINLTWNSEGFKYTAKKGRYIIDNIFFL